MEKTYDLSDPLLGTKMLKDLENTQLMASHFLEKQRVKVRLFFKSALSVHYRWPFLENCVLDICLCESSSWIN